LGDSGRAICSKLHRVDRNASQREARMGGRDRDEGC
jgi:hypothetical protein